MKETKAANVAFMVPAVGWLFVLLPVIFQAEQGVQVGGVM